MLTVVTLYLMRRASLRSRTLKDEPFSYGRSLGWYLAIVPLATTLLQLALLPRAVELGRTRAIRNSAPLITAIERYREANGRYPSSLLALHMDFTPSVMGVDTYRYEPSGAAYNLSFEQINEALGTIEVVVYNPRDEQVATSHAVDLLEFSGQDLERRRGYYAVNDTRHPHWKSFSFD
jgi:hypothetical protein